MGTSDLAKDLHCAHTSQRLPLITSLGTCLLAARDAGLAILDGVYLSSAPYQPPRFHPLPPPTDQEVMRITATIARRVEKLLVRRGLLGEEGPIAPEG